MSHVAVVNVEIKDMEALKAACEKAGLEFREGQRTFRWYGQFVGDTVAPSGTDPKDYGKCEHAIGVPGKPDAYEIGVVRTTEGKTKLMWDFWAGGKGLQAVAGEKCSNLVKAYVGEVTRKAMFRKGYRQDQSKVLEDGTVELVFSHM